MIYARTSFVAVVLLTLLSIAHAADTRPTTQPAGSLPPGVRLVPNLEYANIDGKSLLLDLYLPQTADNKPVPVVMYVHGGGWNAGDKHEHLAVPLVAHGYAVASINYRLSEDAIFPAQIQDCKTAVRWLRAHQKFYALDGAHIGAWGDSAGGHLVALLGTSGGVKEFEGDSNNLDQTSRVQAVCDWFGPSDFSKIGAQAAAAGIPGPHDLNTAKSNISRLLGGPLPENLEKAAKASPIPYITKDCPPFLIMHGEKDQTVPVAQSELLRDALTKAGVEVKLEVIPGAGHGFNTPDAFASVLTFFDAHLKPPKPNPPGAKAAP